MLQVKTDLLKICMCRCVILYISKYKYKNKIHFASLMHFVNKGKSLLNRSSSKVCTNFPKLCNNLTLNLGSHKIFHHTFTLSMPAFRESIKKFLFTWTEHTFLCTCYCSAFIFLAVFQCISSSLNGIIYCTVGHVSYIGFCFQLLFYIILFAERIFRHNKTFKNLLLTYSVNISSFILFKWHISLVCTAQLVFI